MTLRAVALLLSVAFPCSVALLLSVTGPWSETAAGSPWAATGALMEPWDVLLSSLEAALALLPPPSPV